MARRHPVNDEIATAKDVAARVVRGDNATRDDRAASVRTVCALLARDHPGGTLEVRVPPFAATQVGLSERGAHTRGTPPNIVETDVDTMLSLAIGSLTWDDALATHRVRASGVHTDIGTWFPCL